MKRMAAVVLTLALVACGCGRLHERGCDLLGAICDDSEQEPSPPAPSLPADYGWYPTAIPGYAPYDIKPDEALKAGQTEFTEEELLLCASDYIDQRQKLIGADSKTLNLIEIEGRGAAPFQQWYLLYEHLSSYRHGIVDYGTVSLWIIEGRVQRVKSKIIPVVRVPDVPVVSEQAIREGLVDQKLYYYSKIESHKEYEITAKTAVTYRQLVILPRVVEDVLEIRLCHGLEVRAEPGSEPGTGVRWYVFCDAITGETVHSVYPLRH